MPLRRWIVRSLLVLASVGLAALVWNRGSRVVLAAPPTWLLPHEDAQVPVEGRPGCVLDPVVGLRNQRDYVVRMTTHPLFEPDAARTFEHRTDLHGFVRDEPLPEPLTSPRVLLLGDSHMWGVVPAEENAANLLERALRGDPALRGALVLNAASSYYSLYQYALRARTLAAPIQPDVVVAVVFAGNDFYDLMDSGRPHLDEQGREIPADPDPAPRGAWERRTRFADGIDLFFQGFNQASWLYEHPDEVPHLQALTERALDALVDAAGRAELVLAVVPSFDLVFPERAALMGAYESRVVASGGQRAFYAWFVERARGAGLEVVDLEPVFREDRRFDLYARDFHVYTRGHAFLAEALLEPVRARLRGRTTASRGE